MGKVLGAIPVVVLMGLVAVVVLATSPPRTASAHWSIAGSAPGASSTFNYGVVTDGGRLDFLSTDAGQGSLSLRVREGHRWSDRTLDHGTIWYPALSRVDGEDIAVWVRQTGSRESLVAERTDRPAQPVTLVPPGQQIENPQVFAGPGGHPEVVFSWQKFGNFDTFLLPLSRTLQRLHAPYRLTHSAIYSFYPHAATDSRGNVHVLHYEYCCQAQEWRLVATVVNPSGHRVAPDRTLAVQSIALLNNDEPSEWGLAVEEHDGKIWAAYSGESGAYVTAFGPSGRTVVPPHLLDPEADSPPELSMIFTGRRGWLAWMASNQLGNYVEARSFAEDLKPLSGVDRVSYEGTDEENTHLVAVDHHLMAVWSSPNGSGRFEWAVYRPHIQESLADHLGIGLGNAWEQLALLLVSALGFAALATIANLLLLVALVAGGLVMTWILSRLPAWWILYTLLLAAVLCAVFIEPGGWTFLLTTLPVAGLPIFPTDVIIIAAIVAALLWIALYVLRRFEPAFRASILGFAGVYLFAFAEALEVVQHRMALI